MVKLIVKTEYTLTEEEYKVYLKELTEKHVNGHLIVRCLKEDKEAVFATQYLGNSAVTTYKLET